MFNKKDETMFESNWRKNPENLTGTGPYQPGDNIRIDRCAEIIVPGNFFLDIGCGKGVLAQLMQSRFQKVFGIDIAPTAVELACKRGVNAKVVNLNETGLPFQNAYFDTITILSTMQYFYDLDFCFSEVRRVLKPGGQLIVTFPNSRAFWRLGKLAFSGRFPKVSKDSFGYDGGTLHYFCYRDVEDLFLRMEFNILKSRGIFCIPGFINRLNPAGFLNPTIREFFSAEILIEGA